MRQGTARVAQRRRVPDELARGFDLRRHVGELEIDRLMLDERLAEARPLARVGERRVERRARHADRLRRDADAPRLEIRERDPVALAFAPEQIRGGHPAVLEDDLRGVGGALAELLLDARDDVARRRGLDEERRDALLARVLVGDREHDGDVGVLAGRDELLDAVQHEVRALALGARRDRRGVGSHVRLGEAEAAELVAARERHEEALLLHVGAERVDRAADDRVLDADDRRDGTVARGDLLERDRQRQVVEPGAAPALRHDDAQHAQLAERRELRARKMMLAIPARGVRRESLLRERANRSRGSTAALR